MSDAVAELRIEPGADGTVGAASVAVDTPIGPRLRWRYDAADRRHPHLHPLVTPAGHVLSCNAPDDHPWHHGLWFAVKYVNGDNFWEEYDRYGVLRHVGGLTADDGDGRDGDRGDRGEGVGGKGIGVRGELAWIAPDRTTEVLRQRLRLVHHELDESAWALDVEVDLVPAVDVELDRTPFTTWGGYGGLAFRGQPGLVDTTIRLAGERPGDPPVELERSHGRPARWLDLTGRVAEEGEGTDRAGIALLDVPGNPSHPVGWYASTRADTYGDGWANFVNAAFLWAGPRRVSAGEVLSFRYRVVVHDGDRDAARLDDDHARFAADAQRPG